MTSTETSNGYSRGIALDHRMNTKYCEWILARIIHESFYCTRRYAATTSLTAGGLAAQSVNILFKYASFLRVSARPSRVASRRFRHEPS